MSSRSYTEQDHDFVFEITANAFSGRGGNIEITTNNIFGSQFLDISASSQLGLDGEVIINDPDIDIVLIMTPPATA